MCYSATRQHVYNRGKPSADFLNQLLEWGRTAPDDIFEQNSVRDIYSNVKNVLGPWRGIEHRRAVLLEVMRVLAGFESSWNWNEGVDISNPDSDTPVEMEAGAWQVSANSMSLGPELAELVREHTGGSIDPTIFQETTKSNHQFAMEYVARLLRRTVRHHGPVRDHKIDPWLRRDAVEEFLALLATTQDEAGIGELRGGALAIGAADILPTPHGREQIELVFGRPNNLDGTLNELWESQNIIRVIPPPGWQLYYQDDSGPVAVSGIRLHRKLEDNFRSVLSSVWSHAKGEIGGQASDDEVRQWLHERQLDQHAGGFNFRPIAGTNRLSLHSYGIAIDWDADHNPQGGPSRTLPTWWYDIWHAHGWSDGRHFSNPDPMHVQFATGA